MVKEKRYLVKVALIFIVTFVCMLTTSCESKESKSIQVPEVKEDVYIYDQDDIIDEKIETDLNQILIDLEKKCGAEVAVITIKSLNGESLETYANDLANQLGIGKKDENNGVLLLISRSDEHVRLEIGKGLEGCLNDGKCGRILDKYFIPYRDKDDYNQATEKTIKSVVSVIAKENKVSIDNVDSEEFEEDELTLGMILLAIIISIAIIIVIVDVVRDDSNGGGRSSGGSGFGGGSFGGGFGGGSFGGGSFGGGGAGR